jgi:sensor histidine kinase YesM
MRLIISKYKTLNNAVNNHILQHVFYWVIYVCFFGVTWGTYDGDFRKTFSTELISLPSKIFVVYSIAYFLMPRFLFRKKIVEFWLYAILILLTAAIAQRILDNYVIIRYFLRHWVQLSTFHPVAVLSTILQMTAVLAIPATIKIVEYFSLLQQKQQKLEKEKLETELMFLKNQVQPHFLFNTLNSLYSLILKKSDLALDVFLRLSDLLRYLLDEANSTKIELSKEVNFVTSYLELERVRFGKSIKISIKTKGNFDNKFISPLLIIPFIENSVKHSTGGYKHTAKIDIEMALEGDTFLLKVKNNMPQDAEANDQGFSGIGLQNVRKRLDILYGKKYSLEIEPGKDSFTIMLIINLL